ncbi:MAG: adenosylcobinamide-GDP ribazoletransferase [Sulfitobacter sp.]
MFKNDTARDALMQFHVAMTLLTRLPQPLLPRHAFAAAGRAAWAYPLVGALVGVIGLLAGQIAGALGLGEALAAGIALGAMILCTGAMHEDGLADCADGFWGGLNKARRLEIMRDSQIGSYGVLALVMITSLRWSALVTLAWVNIWAVVAAAALSRAMMPWIMTRLPHARRDGLSRSVGAVPPRAAIQAALIGGGIALLCTGFSAVMALLLAAATAWGVMALAKSKIEGQTGDVLGAAQQLCETVILLSFAALLP